MNSTKKKIQIDANPTIMNECHEAYVRGDEKEGRQILKAFLKEVEESGQDHCSCSEPCAFHGNCKACILSHRAGMNHVPSCLRNLVNEKLKVVASLTENTLKEVL